MLQTKLKTQNSKLKINRTLGVGLPSIVRNGAECALIRTLALAKNLDKAQPCRGFSLIEMIIVVSILGLIAVIASGFLLVSLMASNKAEATKEVRQNGNYALSVMEGLILNSSSVGCTGVSNEGVWTKDLEDNLATVIFDSVSKRIASFSGSIGVGTSTYLTGSNVTVSDCFFTCVQDPGRPAKVVINFAVSKGGSGARPSEKASLQFQTTVVTKNY